MRTKYQGNARVKRSQLQRLRRDFETLEMKEGETITEYLSKVRIIANNMTSCGEDMGEVKVVEKILRSLTSDFNFVVCTIEESKDIDELSIDELQSSFLVHEQKVMRKGKEDQVLKTEYEAFSGRGRGRGRSSMSRGRGRGRGEFDKSTIECYKCHQMGHFKGYSQKENKEDDWILDSGCTEYITQYTEWLDKRRASTSEPPVLIPNGESVPVTGKGNSRLPNGIIIKDVLHVPKFKYRIDKLENEKLFSFPPWYYEEVAREESTYGPNLQSPYENPHVENVNISNETNEFDSHMEQENGTHDEEQIETVVNVEEPEPSR
ncbi:uncharacterized protein LOC143578300 [Bidens hawaiensis]|uniref:uncharacterized protein LOC143578300 n=1 Tax=Bidens hawaiensis TaxID=980011 RepID=UPI00404B4A27